MDLHEQYESYRRAESGEAPVIEGTWNRINYRLSIYRIPTRGAQNGRAFGGVCLTYERKTSYDAEKEGAGAVISDGEIVLFEGGRETLLALARVALQALSQSTNSDVGRESKLQTQVRKELELIIKELQ